MSSSAVCVAGAPDPNALIAIKALGTTLVLLAATALQRAGAGNRAEADNQSSERGTSARSDAGTALQPAAEASTQVQQQLTDATLRGGASHSAAQAALPALNVGSSSLLWASAELGLFSAVGSVLQAWGLSRVPASTAGVHALCMVDKAADAACLPVP